MLLPIRDPKTPGPQQGDTGSLGQGQKVKTGVMRMYLTHEIYI